MGQKLCKWLRSTRTACAETQEAAGSEEPACVLCGRVDEDSGILGCKVEIDGLYIHEFCVIFANGLCQYMEGSNEARFCAEDITRTVREAEQTLCFVCGSSGATVICAEPGCEQSFHLPCAYEGQCVTQFFGALRAFCWEHSPQQAVQAEPAPDTTCIICMEPVGDSRSYGTMVCPACQHAWFHRACVQVEALPSPRGHRRRSAAASSTQLTPTLLVFLLQEQALSAGIYCFRCPHCRDKESFLREMLNVGIRIPFRKPTWDDNYTYSSLGVRYERCVAINCLYPLGRGHSGEGPWEMLLCSSCAARATHRRCSQLSNSTTSWECDSCAAGEGTASSTRSRLAGLTTTSQQGLRPSRGSSTESSSSGTSSQAPPGPAHRSGVPESSGLSIQRRTDRRGITPRARRDANSFNESRGRRGRTRNAAPIAGSSSTDSASQGTSRSSRRCPALRYNRRCRQGQRARTRSRSPLRRRAPASPSRPQRHRGSRQTATPGAQSCTRSSSTPAAPGSSRASPTDHGSPCRHPGRARTRSRSPLHRRAADTDSQPRRRRTSRSRRRGPAQGRSRSRVPRGAQHITGRPC
ncbi:PHD finger protein 7-like [Excalfactoria chinensis]|uniref:PHD finger protein 7-like n=1 Tax=Excalfactoria chinensis TaxID=46218 RepID=UPI003B3B253A